MAWTIRTATDYKDCLDQIRQFTQKAFKAGVVTPGSNTGNGTVYGVSASENSSAETWTLSCTTGGGNGVAVFLVTGASSGSQTAATCGVPYSIDETSFTIAGGSTDFIIGDSFTFAIAASTAEWVQDRWDTDYDGDGGYELIQHGIGTGSDEIYVGYNTQTNDSTYWNLLVTGLTGYVDSNAMGSQPGYFPYYDCLNATSFSFLCSFTSRQITIVPQPSSGISGCSYVGWFLPHATPSQWTYPMFCGGSTDDAAQVIGGTEGDHTCFWNRGDSSTESSGAVLDVSAWVEITRFHPRSYGSFDEWRPNAVDDSMDLYPSVPVAESSDNVYGSLEGVYHPTPFTTGGGSLSDGDVLITDLVAICSKDVFRTGDGNVIAIELQGDV